MTLLIWRDCCIEEEYNESYVENLNHLSALGVNLYLAQPEPVDLPVISIVFERGPITDFFKSSNFFVVSKRLRMVIEQFQVAGEFLPCQVRHEQGISVTQPYFFFNMLDVVECFDFERSEYGMSPHGVDSIEKLVLSEDTARGHHLFWVGQLPSRQFNSKAVRIPLRCASSDLATAIIRAGCTGVRFVLPEHFNDYPPENVEWAPET